MTRHIYDITVLGTEGGELVARSRFHRLKARDEDSAALKAVRLFCRAFRGRHTDEITVDVGRI